MDVSQPTARRYSWSRREKIVSRILTDVVPACPLVGLVPPGATDRKLLERRIAEKFARQYGARIEHFLPYLLNLTVVGEPGAIVGLRPAANDQLFLEQYLDAPIEQAISRAQKTPVDRSQVVEIGNLVSTAPGAASLLFGILPTILTMSGLRWVACTATPQVRAMLDKLGFPARTICTADPRVLGERERDWGSYYDSRPQVIVGDVQEALTQASNSGLLHDLAQHLRIPLLNIAAVLRAAH